jgi:hypothetical protein
MLRTPSALIDLAVADVAAGMTFRQAADRHGVKVNSVRRKCNIQKVEKPRDTSWDGLDEQALSEARDYMRNRGIRKAEALRIARADQAKRARAKA